MNTKYTYALYINNTDYDNDMADWFGDLDAAMQAGRAAIAEDAEATVEIMKFDTKYHDCQWDSYITIDSDGDAWAETADAREEMGCIQ